MFSLPFFEKLESAQNILLAGAGGGFDFFCGLPLYESLRRAGKTVHLANLTFSDIDGARGKMLAPHLMEVTADTLGNERYFPEMHFSRWMRGRNEEVSVYAFERTGVVPFAEAYKVLCDKLEIDALVLIDGGTDSLMRGDEFGLGTPMEDVSSILAANVQDVPIKMLACIGFGVDAFHGVCHAQFLEAVAELAQKDAYLGTWSVLKGSPGVEFYKAACEHVFRKMPTHPSIVSSSIVSAIEGHFGDYHTTSRTRSSKLFINPLMALTWSFELGPVAERLLYPKAIAETLTQYDIVDIIGLYRAGIVHKPFESLPM